MQQVLEVKRDRLWLNNGYLGESVLDAYMLPSGEKRLGIEGTSVVGYTDSWFYNRTNEDTLRLKSGLFKQVLNFVSVAVHSTF